MLRKPLPVICLGVILGIVTAPAYAQIYNELISFNGNTAAEPMTPLTQGVDGDLYGTTAYGGTGDCTGNTIGCGVIFKITRGGAFRILYNFQANGGLVFPYGNLVLGLDNSLYGLANGGGANGTIFRVTPEGTLSVVHSFIPGNDAGYDPTALTLGVDGNFYGAAASGGTPSNSCPSGCGTIYKMTPAGVVTTLYSFCPQNYCPMAKILTAPWHKGWMAIFMVRPSMVACTS